MKIFQDYRARKKFYEIYSMLTDEAKTKFAELVRNKADEKIVGDEHDEFYITEEDVNNCYAQISI